MAGRASHLLRIEFAYLPRDLKPLVALETRELINRHKYLFRGEDTMYALQYTVIRWLREGEDAPY